MASQVFRSLYRRRSLRRIWRRQRCPLISSHPNIVVVRTSQIPRLAGLRLGYAIGAPGMIEAMNRIKDSVNLSGRCHCPETGSRRRHRRCVYTKKRSGANRRDTRAYRRRPFGYGLYRTALLPNFIFAGRGPLPARDIMPKLQGAGRYCPLFPGGRIDDFLRITVGTDPQMDEFLKKLNKILY